jgi:hypothetical protein
VRVELPLCLLRQQVWQGAEDEEELFWIELAAKPIFMYPISRGYFRYFDELVLQLEVQASRAQGFSSNKRTINKI